MNRPDRAARTLARASRPLRRAVCRLRWGRRIVLLAAPAAARRQDHLDAALARLPRRFRVVRIPYGAMPAGEICALALAALDRGLAGDPERALLAAVAANGRRRQRLVLAIEEADHMPVVEARRLRELTARAAGALRILVVSSPGPDEERLREALEGGRRHRRQRQVPQAPAASRGLVRLRGPLPPPPTSAPSRRVAPEGPALSSPAPYRYAGADQALEALVRLLRDGRPLVGLVGPPGIGKTVLMRRLAAALADDFDPVWVPGMAFPPDQLLRWMLYCRTRRHAEVDARRAWRREVALADAAGRPLLLLLDDAGALLPEAAAALATEIEQGEGRLRIALSLCEGRYREGEGADRLPFQRVRLDAPLSPAQSMDFLHDQLGARLDAALLARVVEEARGIPAALLRGASGWLARHADRMRSAAPSVGR